MSYTQSLRDQRAHTARQMHDILDAATAGARGLTPEEESRWQQLDAEQEAKRKQIDLLERQDGIEGSAGVYEGSAGGLQTRFDRGPSGLGRWMRALVRQDRSVLDEYETRAALAEGSPGTGGVLVPIELSQMLIDRLRPAMVTGQAGAQVVSVSTDQTTIPRLVTDPVPQWLSEGASLVESEPTFDQVVLQPKTLFSLVKASIQLVEDGLNIEQRIEANLQAVMAHALDKTALYGAGGTEPLGLTGQSDIGTVSMGTNGALLTSYDPFLQARQELLEANVQLPPQGSNWIMSPRSEFELNSLKASTINQPLQRPPALARDNFLATTTVPEDLTWGTASTASQVIGGNFADLLIAVRTNVSILPLRERFMDQGLYAWACYARVDVAVAHPASFVVVEGVL